MNTDTYDEVEDGTPRRPPYVPETVQEEENVLGRTHYDETAQYKALDSEAQIAMASHSKIPSFHAACPVNLS